MLRTILILIAIAITTSRVYQQTFTFSAFRRQNGWLYLSKISLSPGTSTVEFKTLVKGALTSPIDVDFAIINQANFHTQSYYKCQNSNYEPTLSIIHTLTPNNVPSMSVATLEVQKEQYYYFLVRDCKKQISANASLNTIVVSTSLVIKNNGAHLGSEEDIGAIYPITMVVYALLIFVIYKQNPLDGDKNWFQFILMLGMVVRLSGLFWKFLGFLIYSSTGNNYTIFEIFYLALHGLQECTIISIVILVGFGWNMLFVNHPDFDIFMTLLALLSTLNIILNVLNVINDDSYQKYHMYDTIPSIIQTAFRVISLFCLLGGMKYSWPNLNPQRRSFLLKFGTFGFFYILSLPILLILVRYIQTCQQSQFISITSEIFQLLSVSYLTYLCTYKKSGYNKVILQNNTFLPVGQNQKYF